MRSFLGIGKNPVSQGFGFGLPKKTAYFCLAWLLLLVAILATTAVVRIVLNAPQRTPMFVFTTEYDVPWSQQSHSTRIPDVLQTLHRRNLQCEPMGDGSSFRDADWVGIEETIRRYDSQTRQDVPLLFYVGFHGVVDKEGRPFLLVSHSIPNRPETWLSLQELFQRVSRSANQNRNLVFLFPHGTIPHHLADEPTLPFSSAVNSMVDRMVRENQVHRIACLVDDGTNDTYVRSLAENSQLTIAIARGLEGEADRSSGESNRDNVVAWHELVAYVDGFYSSQKIADRGIPARIQSIVHGPAPSSIAWALSSSAKPNTEPLPSVESQEALESAWLRFGSLHAQHPWLTQPRLWTELKQMGLAAERDLFSGDLKQGEQRIAEFRRLADSIDALSNQANSSAKDRGREVAKRFAEQWRVVSQKSVLSWQSFCEQLRSVAPEESQWDPMLYQLSRSPKLGLWDQASLLQDFATYRAIMEKHRESRIDLPEDPLLTSREDRVLESCRRLQDRILANQPIDELSPLMKQFESTWKEYASRYQNFLAQTSNKIETARELPRLCLAIDALSLAETPVEGLSAMQSLASECIQDVTARKQTSDNSQSTSRFVRLQSLVYKAWSQLLKSTDKSPIGYLQLDRLLVSGAMPSSDDSYKDGIILRMRSLQALAAWDRRSKESHASIPSTKAIQSNLWSQWRKATKSFSETVKPDSELDRSVLFAHSQQAIWATPDATIAVDRFAALWRRTRLLRTASIVLDDFWHWDESDPAPYFATEAERLIQEAESIRVSNDETSIAETRAKLVQRRSAATKPFEFSMDWKVQSTTQQVLGWECSFRRTTLGVGLPSGDAFVTPVGSSVSPLVITIEPNMMPQSLGAVSDDQSETWTPSLTFRGRRYSGPPFQSNASSVTTATYDKDRRTSIMIQDGRKQQRARMIILDCSASMAEAVAAEGIGSTTQLLTAANSPATMGPSKATKLDAARVALRQVLDQWRGGSDWIGFSIFGHRVASSPGANNLLQVKYLRAYPFAQNLQAYEDVESILSVGRFGDTEFASVMDRLNHLVPWGQTPLYLAILDALERMRNVDSTIPRDIVVVSDGRNYQFNPPAERNIPLEWVIDVAREQSIRIHLIGFGIPEDETWEAAQQYQRLASETGGTVVMQVANAMTLVQNLKAHESTFQYQIQLPEGEPFVAQTNQEVRLPTPRSLNTPLTIDFGGNRRVIPINSGAAIQMRSEAGRLVSTGYTGRPVEMRTPLVDRLGRATPFVLVTARPRFDRELTHWEFSLERTDGEISQRPRHVLVELEPSKDGSPIHNGKSPQFYASSETNWKSQTSVPTLSMTTANWPTDATEVQVRFWCADSEWEPIETISAMSSNEGTSEKFGFRYRVVADDRGLVVCIQESDSGVDLRDIYPRLSTDRPVSEVERRFHREPSLAMHRFRWDLEQSREVNRDNIRIEFCHARSVRDIGLRPSSPIRIPISVQVAGRESGSRR